MRYIHLHYSLMQLHYNYNYHTTQITISQQKPYKIKPTFATIILRINTHKFQQQCNHLCAKSYCQLKLAYFQPVNSRFLQVVLIHTLTAHGAEVRTVRIILIFL